MSRRGCSRCGGSYEEESQSDLDHQSGLGCAEVLGNKLLLLDSKVRAELETIFTREGIDTTNTSLPARVQFLGDYIIGLNVERDKRAYTEGQADGIGAVMASLLNLRILFKSKPDLGAQHSPADLLDFAIEALHERHQLGMAPEDKIEGVKNKKRKDNE